MMWINVQIIYTLKWKQKEQHLLKMNNRIEEAEKTADKQQPT